MILEQTPAQLAQLSSAQGRGDLGEVKRLAHSLKGAVANIGGKQMSTVLQKVEHTAGAHTSDAPKVLDGLAQEATQAWQALASELRGFLERAP